MYTHNKSNRKQPRTRNPHKQKNPRNSNKQNPITPFFRALPESLKNLGSTRIG
jgi:hypothetical protein